MKSRIVSVILVGLIVLLAQPSIERFEIQDLRGFIGLLFPLALIWFAEPLGQYTGYVGRGGYIESPTPSFLVAAVGWIWIIAILIVTGRDYLAQAA